MQYRQTIQRLLAFLMLLLFVTSITPKRFLHHWFADHKDVQAKLATHSLLGHGEAQLYSSSVNCDCNDLVATSPFTHETEIIDWTVPVSYGQPTVRFTCDTYSTDLLLSNLRGPPSQA